MIEDALRETLDAAATKVTAGERISPDEALLLLRHERLTTLGALADMVRRTKHPEGIVTYIIDRNINYTNVCNAFCSFCAFYRAPDLHFTFERRTDCHRAAAQGAAVGGLEQTGASDEVPHA